MAQKEDDDADDGDDEAEHEEADDTQGDAGPTSVEALLEYVQGLSPEEAEEQIRAYLDRSTGEAPRDADIMAILLKVFRAERDWTLDGYQSDWKNTVAYCKHLTSLCDRNFVNTMGGEQQGETLDFPASVVAIVYAECGRSLALMEEFQHARELLSKSLTVFAIVPDREDAGHSIGVQKAAARAALARVLRRLAQLAAAEKEYLQALQLHVSLPPAEDLSHLITEYCSLLGELNSETFAAPDFLCDLSCEKFGAGSEPHLKALKEVAEVCEAVDRLHLAAPILDQRAILLRERCSDGGGKGAKGGHIAGLRRSPGALLQAEAAAAEEEAAQAFEAAAARKLQEGKLKEVADNWTKALRLRDAAGAEGSVIEEMRAALSAVQAALAAGAGGPATITEVNEDSDVLEDGELAKELQRLKEAEAELAQKEAELEALEQSAHDLPKAEPLEATGPKPVESPKPAKAGSLTAPLWAQKPSLRPAEK